MKRRTKRDLTIFVSILLAIGGFVFANTQFSRRGLAEDFEKMRAQLEKDKAGTGIDLLKWNIVRTTKGTLSGGGIFSPELKAYDGKEVFIIGFMVPEEQFRDVTEFLLLPIPIECYFCSMPPSRDVLYVKLRPGDKEQIYNEPILIRGTLQLHEGKGVKFFYTMPDATFKNALDGGELTKKRIAFQHMVGGHQPDPNSLLPGWSEPKDAVKK